MPSVSQKQKHFMAMSSNPKGRAALRQYGVKPAPMSVAKEYLAADKRTKKKLPLRKKRR